MMVWFFLNIRRFLLTRLLPNSNDLSLKTPKDFPVLRAVITVSVFLKLFGYLFSFFEIFSFKVKRVETRGGESAEIVESLSSLCFLILS